MGKNEGLIQIHNLTDCPLRIDLVVERKSFPLHVGKVSEPIRIENVGNQAWLREMGYVWFESLDKNPPHGALSHMGVADVLGLSSAETSKMASPEYFVKPPLKRERLDDKWVYDKLSVYHAAQLLKDEDFRIPGRKLKKQ